MIVKELEAFTSVDRFAKAGRTAEEQMAFYLKRAFGSEKDIFVFNNLRLEKDGDAAQIDHLILNRYSTVIIESKSVSAQVEVNEHGEWKRCFNENWQGIPSPLLQAQRQGTFLRKYLGD